MFKTKIMKNISILEIIDSLIAILFALLCFTSLYTNDFIIIFSLFFICIFHRIISKNITIINYWMILYFVFCVWLLGSALANNYSDYLSLAYIGIILFIIIMCSKLQIWQRYLYIISWIICFIYTVFTIIQFLYPNLVILISSIILNPDDLMTNLRMLKGGAYAGITNQTGINAYFITIYLVITYVYFKTNYRNYIKKNKGIFIYIFFALLLLIGIFALILTKKRLFLIAIFLCFIIISYNNKKNILNYLISIILAVFVIIIFIIFSEKYISQIGELINRFVAGNDTGDYSSGRLQLWQDALSLFIKKPIFGWGWFSSIKLLSSFGVPEVPHNAYIQMLLEVGIIGFIPYLSLLSYYSYKSVYALVKNPGNINILISINIQIIFLLWSFTGNPVWDKYPFVLYLLTLPIINANTIVNKMKR